MEGIRSAGAVGSRIGERSDNPKLLYDGAGPSMRDDERQCIFMP